MPVKAATAAAPLSVPAILKELETLATTHDHDNLARFGIAAPKAFGVSIANIQKLAHRIGRDHALAAALWKTGWYEARLLTAFVDEPDRVTSAQMDRWCRDFDNWGICDTICFHLFDRTPYAWDKVAKWHGRREEFVKRGAFALLASLALHDKKAGDRPFVEGLGLIESSAADERNFVKKGISWALRLIGRRNAALNAEALDVARRLAAASSPAASWIGRDAVKELTGPVVRRQLGRKQASRRR